MIHVVFDIDMLLLPLFTLLCCKLILASFSSEDVEMKNIEDEGEFGEFVGYNKIIDFDEDDFNVFDDDEVVISNEEEESLIEIKYVDEEEEEEDKLLTSLIVEAGNPDSKLNTFGIDPLNDSFPSSESSSEEEYSNILKEFLDEDYSNHGKKNKNFVVVCGLITKEDDITRFT